MTELKNIMFCATAFAPSLLGAKELPNIIYIVTDQQTASAMSCMGNTDVHTPNMDRLAQAGILFKNAYCSAPLSGPSRASMFTGHTSHEVGLSRNNVPMADSLRTASLGWLMQRAGYECAYGGKWHVHTPSMPDGEFGFSTIHPHNDNGLAEASVAFLEQKHSKPFFLVVGFDNPHNIRLIPPVIILLMIGGVIAAFTSGWWKRWMLRLVRLSMQLINRICGRIR